MLSYKDIEDFCEKKNYDIGLTGNGRWIDQKCAADVVSVVADCIINYHKNQDGCFTSRDIWHSSYTIENVEALFMKPGVENKKARNEYDKFFQQPMEMLAYAGVLQKDKLGKCNYYKIKNYDVLEYIAIRERNALYFLKTYIEKVLKDSNIYDLFEDFFVLQNKESYKTLKEGYTQYIIANTPINGETECHRIFIKVLNPLAFYKQCCGTERGDLSKHPITYDMLMYNRDNFRDEFANKPKGMTRKEYAEITPVVANEAYYCYQSSKAKHYLRLFNNEYRAGKTEHLEDNHMNDAAVHMHHIFPESEFPEICYYLENIIALTPTQHLSYAHPNGNTREIDEQYQNLLLLSKADRIKENILCPTVETIYDFFKFTHVLNVGFDDDNAQEISEMDFCAVVNFINMHYIPVSNRD